MKLVIASNNKNKIIEIENKFSDIINLQLMPLDRLDSPPDVVEDGDTFEENALKKAESISEFCRMPAMSDDSGLVIDALGGRPGVLSARYGGDKASDYDKNLMILEEMKDIPDRRSARFVCVIAICFPDGESRLVRGECHGVIAHSASGDKGFGYDPIFFLPDLGKTMAELSIDEKNRISHRALALDKAGEIIRGML